MTVATDKTLVYRFLRTLSWCVLKSYNRMSVEGAQNIPASGGVVLAANHTTHLDIPIISCVTNRHVAFVARDSLDSARWLSFVMRQCRAVLVKRGTADTRAIRAMVEHLDAGDCVAIYPEGTRSRDGRLGPLKPGVAVLATTTGCPVIPVRLDGIFEALPKSAWMVRFRSHGIVRFRRPLRAEPGESTESFLARLTDALAPAAADIASRPRGADHPQAEGTRA